MPAIRAASKVLVAGSGVVGLRTALELLRRGVSVVLRSRHGPLHPSTCSQGAGGLWMPFHCDDPRVGRWSTETLDELHRYVAEAENARGDSPRLVELVHAVSLFRDNRGPQVDDFLAADYRTGQGGRSPIPGWTADPRLEFQHLTVEMLAWQNAVLRLKIPPQEELLDAGYKHVWLFRPPIVDSPRMLASMLREIEAHPRTVGVDLDMAQNEGGYESLEHLVDDARSMECDAVVNCTSLGSTSILNDTQLVGARGILLHYDRSDCPRRDVVEADAYGPLTNDAVIAAEEGPWGSESEPCYLIPRGDTVVVGGSYLEHDREPTIRDTERRRLLENARRMGIDTSRCQPSGEWVGFRPYRNPTRCELDGRYNGQDGSMRVVHSYGYGGSGWTVCTGTAREVARILESTA